MKNILYTIILSFSFSFSVFAEEIDSESLQEIYNSMRYSWTTLMNGEGEVTENDYNDFWKTIPISTIEQKKYRHTQGKPAAFMR